MNLAARKGPWLKLLVFQTPATVLVFFPFPRGLGAVVTERKLEIDDSCLAGCNKFTLELEKTGVHTGQIWFYKYYSGSSETEHSNASKMADLRWMEPFSSCIVLYVLQ